MKPASTASTSTPPATGTRYAGPGEPPPAAGATSGRFVAAPLPPGTRYAFVAVLLATSESRGSAPTSTRFCTSVPRPVPGARVPVTVTFGGALSDVGTVTRPRSQTTVNLSATEHPPCVVLAAVPSRPTLVLSVTRTPDAVPAPVPVTTMVWVTDCPATAPNGVEVSAGTRSTPSAGACATAGP